jgi:tyrosyl-tRNA synthetase
MLTREQVDANAKTYFDQVFLVLDRKQTEVHGNAEWLAQMGAADVLRLLGKATLQQVLQREDFAERMKAGAAIGAHEILYPFNQAYDSVAVHADVEIGGTDQLFNLLFGRDIQKAYGQEPQDIAVFPLLEGTDGVQKMSKSLGNYIGISEPPEQIYGKTMSIPDPLIEKYLRLISGLSPSEIEATLKLKPRDAKAALARQLVKRLHGEEAAARAETDFDQKFRQHLAPDEMPEIVPSNPEDLTQTLVEAGLARTRSEANRLIQQGGVSVKGTRVSGLPFRLEDGDVVKVGKRNFVRIRLK